MEFIQKKKIGYYQEGGEMAPAETAPEQAAVQDPMQQSLQVAVQAVQNQDCEAAMAVCQALLQLAQGGAPQEQAPQEEPTFAKRGAKLVRVR